MSASHSSTTTHRADPRRRDPDNRSAQTPPPASRRRRALGERGEEAVACYLEERGWRILERNFCCRGGELDLVVTRDDVLAFVEVRTARRRSRRAPRPEDTLSRDKRDSIECAAARWIVKHPRAARRRVIRFDVAGLDWDGRSSEAALRYHANAFQARRRLL